MIQFARKSFLGWLCFASTKTTTTATVTTLEEVDEETTKIMTSTTSSTTATTEDHHHHHHTPNSCGKPTIHITTHEVLSLTMHHRPREPERPSKDEGSGAQNNSISV